MRLVSVLLCPKTKSKIDTQTHKYQPPIPYDRAVYTIHSFKTHIHMQTCQGQAIKVAYSICGLLLNAITFYVMVNEVEEIGLRYGADRDGGGRLCHIVHTFTLICSM